MTLASQLSPIIDKVHDAVLDHQADERGRIGWSKEDLLAMTHLFASAVLELSDKHTQAQAQMCGMEIRGLVKHYTGLDTYKLVRGEE